MVKVQSVCVQNNSVDCLSDVLYYRVVSEHCPGDVSVAWGEISVDLCCVYLCWSMSECPVSTISSAVVRSGLWPSLTSPLLSSSHHLWEREMS